MVDWKFWEGFSYGAITAILPVFALIKGIAAIKTLFPNRAKPQLLDVQNCCIIIEPDFEQFWFELLVDNAAGLKDCSVISVELKLPNGDISKCVFSPESTRLPKTIIAGQSERIIVYGQCGGVAQYGKCKGKLPRPSLQSQHNPIEGVIVVKFNTNKIIKKKAAFTITPFFPND